MANPTITDWANAIKQYEGFFAPGQNPKYPDGTLSWKNNNPGNIRSWPNTPQNGGFAHFPTYDVGFAALCTLLTNAATGKSANYKPTMSLVQFFAVYAPSDDHNDPNAYADFIAKKLQVDPNTFPISQFVA
jgi:hypothetical protein